MVSAYAWSRAALGVDPASRYSAPAAAMNPRSRAVLIGSAAARSAACAPLVIRGPVGPPAKGLPHALRAMPQCAMAQPESAARTAPNALSALVPPEGMKHSHCVLEAALRLGTAGNGKHHPAQVADVVRRVVLLGGEESGDDERDGERGAAPHGEPEHEDLPRQSGNPVLRGYVNAWAG